MAAFRLPCEKDFVDAMRRSVSGIIEMAYALLELGIRIPENAQAWSNRLGYECERTILALFVKTNLLFRSAILLYEHGLDRPALALNRSLFEAYLLLEFLTRERVELFKTENGNRQPFRISKEELTIDLRHRLYWAWSILRESQSWSKSNEVRKRIAEFPEENERGIEEELAQQLERTTINKLKNANTCAGVSISDLAKSLGSKHHDWYVTIYSSDCAFHHHSEIDQYFQDHPDESAFVWFTSAEDVAARVVQAACLYLDCLYSMHDRFVFPAADKDMLDNFSATLTGYSAST